LEREKGNYEPGYLFTMKLLLPRSVQGSTFMATQKQPQPLVD